MATTTELHERAGASRNRGWNRAGFLRGASHVAPAERMSTVTMRRGFPRVERTGGTRHDCARPLATRGRRRLLPGDECAGEFEVCWLILVEDPAVDLGRLKKLYFALAVVQAAVEANAPTVAHELGVESVVRLDADASPPILYLQRPGVAPP